ncbi:MAG: calcium/sodium antiporter [Treponemataceae bacterium]|nr:calcium/sodium antiporter [Spirochaetales bacterium]MDY6031755.1 calcium/sodium antiporter [Treponemataceae bacterium]
MLSSLMNGPLMYVFLLVGFVFLIKGADFFVDGASSIARILKVSPLIIGLTIVAFGTSFPELAVSVTSAIKGQNALAVGNVVGSNIFNTLMVLGFSAIFMPVLVQKNLIQKDLPFNILISFVLFVLSFDIFFSNFGAQTSNILSRGDGIVLLSLFVVYMFYVVFSALASRREFEEQTEGDIKQMGVVKSIIFTVCGAAAIVIGGDLTVDAATAIALHWGMSETLVGLTIVAIGTSLPELVTSIIAAKKGECDLAVGNVVGSNIFNILLILGVSSVINPIELTDPNLLVDMLVMLGISVMVFGISIPKKIRRWEGIILILMYAAYMTYIVLR